MHSLIEICAGAGGQSLGLHKAGFHHELAVELDPTAASTLRSNLGDADVRIGDVADGTVWSPNAFAPISSASSNRIDLFAGGVPCPPFSIAGKQLGVSDERDLFAWSIEQVGIMRPRAVMLENVRGLAQARFAAYRQHVLDRLEEFGYAASWRLIQASDFGVPQLRPRFVLVAMDPEEMRYFRWPEPVVSQLTVGEALVDLMGKAGWEGAAVWATRANGIAPTLVGGSKKHGGADLGPTRAKTAWARLGVDGHGIADAPPPSGAEFAVGPRLTLEMAARVQGWDSETYSWNFCGRKTSVYRQIGNAFPPPVAFALGQSIAAALRHEGVPSESDYTRVDADSVASTLKRLGGFVEGSRLMREAGLEGAHESELDRRIAELSHNYDVESKARGGLRYYRIGEFKGFTGQKDHIRHRAFSDLRNTVS